MKEPLGDTLFWLATIILGLTFIAGWVVLIVVMLLQWLFPKFDNKFEAFLQTVSKPLGLIQKYSIYAIVILFLIRLIVGWLGWAPPLTGIDDE